MSRVDGHGGIWNWDVFVCHATRDKKRVARPLARRLEVKGLRVWYDDFQLRVGDRIVSRIEDGLRQSKVGVVILSQEFFDGHASSWRYRELDALLQLMQGERRILPVLYGVTAEEVARRAPLLGGVMSCDTARGQKLHLVAERIHEAIIASDQPRASAVPRRRVSLTLPMLSVMLVSLVLLVAFFVWGSSRTKESAGQELGKQELGKQELGKQELGKQELGKQELGKQELGKQELGKQELGKQELGKQELGKQELGKQELGKQESLSTAGDRGESVEQPAGLDGPEGWGPGARAESGDQVEERALGPAPSSVELEHVAILGASEHAGKLYVNSNPISITGALKVLRPTSLGLDVGGLVEWSELGDGGKFQFERGLNANDESDLFLLCDESEGPICQLAVVHDDVPPHLQLEGAQERVWTTNDEAVRIAVVASDQNLKSVHVNDRSMEHSVGSSWEIPHADLPVDGENVFTIKARDIAGNVATLDLSVWKDVNPPMALEANVVQGSRVDPGTPVFISVKFNEALASASCLDCDFDVARDVLSGWLVAPSVKGQWIIRIDVVDLAGNHGSWSTRYWVNPIELEGVESGGVEAERAAYGFGSWEVLDSTSGFGELPRRVKDPATGIIFVLIAPGSFEQGAPSAENGDSDERPVRRVRVSSAYYLAETEVTVAQWERMSGSEIGLSEPGDFPVTGIPWERIGDVCQSLNYRLPTEAEWEYACRADTSTAFSKGQCLDPGAANFDASSRYKGCSRGRESKGRVAVRTYAPNSWGLYEMHGNVWEFCADSYSPHFYKISDRPRDEISRTDPLCTRGSQVVRRGGAWSCRPELCRSANRDHVSSTGHFYRTGFRPAYTPALELGDRK